MVVQLTKGARFNISKEAPDSNKVAISLGWEFANPAQSYDIDASVFMLGSDGKLPHEQYLVFYNNLQSFDGALLQSTPKSEAEKPRKKKRRKQPKTNNQVSARNRKIPIALLAGLGVLIMGVSAGAIASFKAQEATLSQAKILIGDRETFINSIDINFLQDVQQSLKKSVANLEKIPNFPGFAYQQAQSDLANLRPSLVSVEQNIKAGQSLENAQKLAVAAAIAVQNPPHTVEVWHQLQRKWQQAIALLQAIPPGTSVYLSAQQKLSNYLANQTVISQRFATAQKAVTFSNQGSMNLQKADCRGAIADFNQAINLNHNLPQASLGLGISHSKLGNSQQAIQHYNQALKFNANFADAYFSRGQAYYEIGNKQKAIADYDQTIRLNPNYALAYLERGAIRYQIRSKPQGFQDFRQAAELFSKQGDTNNYELAQTLVKKFEEPTSPSPDLVKCNYSTQIDSLGRRCGVRLNIPIISRKIAPPNSSNSDTNVKNNTRKQEIIPSNSDSSSSRTRRSRRRRR